MAAASGMNDFLAKPIDINQLLKKLGADKTV
jgi:CheY-like chemotaxis protein